MKIEGVSEPEGDPRVLAGSVGSFGGLEHMSPLIQRYEIARGSTQWEAAPLQLSGFADYTLEGVSPDFQDSLENIIEEAGAPPHKESVILKKVYLRLPDGSLKFLGPLESPTGEGTIPTFIGASEDMHRVVLLAYSRNTESTEPSELWPGDTTAEGRLPSLYEYEYTGEEAAEPRLVGVSNTGTPRKVGEGHLISNCGTTLGSFPAALGDVYNAVSASGAAVFFTAAACIGGPPVDEVYARLRATPSAPAHTVAISEPTSGDCGECQFSNPTASAQFTGASLDGSKVFFTTDQRLLLGATGAGAYLYMYDFDRPAGARVVLLSTGDAAGPRVQGVARVSEDGSHVYFVAKGRLTGEPRGGGCLAELTHAELIEEETTREGRCRPKQEADNLYVHDAATGGTAFVATLSDADAGDWSATDERPVQATPDGRFAVFQSRADLTPDQEGRPEAGQVFEYDARSETLVRVSRSQGGYNEDGNSNTFSATIPVQNYAQETVFGIGRSLGLAVSADGSRVFFSSMDALTPQALSGVKNVYGYHAGQVGLISDGHDAAVLGGRPVVELIGADESGRDVFFTTADPLVPQDTDAQVDVYDARVEGGFSPPLLRAPCAGDSCQTAPSALPSLPLPAVSSPTGEASIQNTPSTQRTPSRKKTQSSKKKPKRHGHRPSRRGRKARGSARKLHRGAGAGAGGSGR